MVEIEPNDLRDVRLKRRLGGYDRKTVDRLLEAFADSYTFVWRECAELKERVDHDRVFPPEI